MAQKERPPDEEPRLRREARERAEMYLGLRRQVIAATDAKAAGALIVLGFVVGGDRLVPLSRVFVFAAVTLLLFALVARRYATWRRAWDALRDRRSESSVPSLLDPYAGARASDAALSAALHREGRQLDGDLREQISRLTRIANGKRLMFNVAVAITLLAWLIQVAASFFDGWWS